MADTVDNTPVPAAPALAPVPESVASKAARMAARMAANAARRAKILLGASVGLAIGLYDVVTAGGIDLNNVLTPILGQYMDVGRALATVSLMILIARFAMQNHLFTTANKNGLDNPDDPNN